MTSVLYEEVFTDSVKDVIGNDPVLDQFDVSYDASFYGSMIDGYVTGTLLDKRRITGNETILIPGSRGRIFSKLYAEKHPPLSVVYGSDDVNQNPNLSYRLVPWQERVSHTNYRVAQFFDNDERYYDTCLPNVKRCFEANGSKVWHANVDYDPFLWLSPYGNVSYKNTGYLMFNYGGNSTLSDNSWTWSYPYESRYNPLQRNLNTGQALKFDTTTTSVDLPFFTSSAPRSNVQYLNDAVSYPKIDPLSFSISQTTKPRLVRNFLPLLPGYLTDGNLSPEGENSLRFYSTMASGSTQLTVTDSNRGFSVLVPSDVRLNSLVSQDYLDNFPVSKPSQTQLTGTMTNEDLIKFLFGFGDNNNMTYNVAASYSTSSIGQAYLQNFEMDNTPTSASYSEIASNLGTYANSDGIIIDWGASPSLNPWKVTCRNATYLMNSEIKNYISGVFSSGGTTYYVPPNTPSLHVPAGATIVAGLFWSSTSSPSNSFVLVSDTDKIWSGSLQESGGVTTSIASVEITSSHPWTFNYERAVPADSSDTLMVYFSGWPLCSSNQNPLGAYGLLTGGLVEIVTGSSSTSIVATRGPAPSAASIYGHIDEMVKKYKYDTNNAWTGPVMPMGEYRLNFAYKKSNSGGIGWPDFAAIDNFQVLPFTASLDIDSTTPKFGANNYPQFKKVKADPRFNPIVDAACSLSASGFVSGTADIYRSYNFGISPVIRGWKYGLYSGLPINSKAVFRRDRFGQFRDMLEQRQYTKFIKGSQSPVDNEAITVGSISKQLGNIEVQSVGGTVVGEAVVTVNFVNQDYIVDDRSIGEIRTTRVSPQSTLSQNLSVNATSSLPYFDGIARHRQESELSSIVSTVFSTVDGNGNLVI